MNIIAGGGKYGTYAVELLREKGMSFVVVDVDPNCLAATHFGLKTVSSVEFEGEFFIRGDLKVVLNLMETLDVEFVFPTVPTHLAADLARTKYELQPWSVGLEGVLSRLPQAVILQAGKGRLITSFNRDHHCIDKCSMPVLCPSSGARRPCTMTELLKFASPEAFVLVSHSVAPGIGALKSSELVELLDWAGRKTAFLVATACDCHGVLSAFKKIVP